MSELYLMLAAYLGRTRIKRIPILNIFEEKDDIKG